MISFAGLRRTAIAVATVLVTLALSAAPASAIPAPKVMAALGDSITRAFNSDGPGCPTGPGLDCDKNSFSTGTNPLVNSQFLRIGAIHPSGPEPDAHNYAVTGARVGGPDEQRSIDLFSQAQRLAAEQDPDYVTIEIGANDACRSNIANQTPTETFRRQAEKSLDELVEGDPQVYIEMLSIPDINQLYTLFSSDPIATARWAPGGVTATGVCQALLANAPSDEPDDVARRAAFQTQVIAYNGALEQACSEFMRCRFDNNAVFESPFTVDDVATVANTAPLPNGFVPADYFHPSLMGQEKLARVSWEATFPMH
jgi:lysophospholipase L1-like esterase